MYKQSWQSKNLEIINADLLVLLLLCKCKTNTFMFIHSLVFSLRGRLAGTRAQSCDQYGSGTLHPGQVLGVVCHCSPPPLDVPTFAARCLYVRDVRDPSSERWKCGWESFPVILPKFRLPHKFRDLLHAANLRHGTDGFTSPPKEGVVRIFSP